jgi:FkbM family methyltransferase
MNLVERIYRLAPHGIRRRVSNRIKIGLASTNIVQTRAGFKMDLDPNEWLQNQIRAGNTYEPETVSVIRSIVSQGDTCIDCGSHVGYLSLICAQLAGSGGKVIAIDPQPANCAKVLRNALLNSFFQIHVVNAAAGAIDSLVHLKEQEANDRSKLSLLDGWSQANTAVGFTTAIFRIDTLVHSLNLGASIRLVKIDAENYELDVLQGCTGVVSFIENIIIEVHPHGDAARNEMTVAWLEDNGFKLFDMSGAPWRLGMPSASHNIWASRSR